MKTVCSLQIGFGMVTEANQMPTVKILTNKCLILMTGITQGVVYYVLLQWYQKWENLPTTWAAGRSASQEIGKRSGPHLNTKTVFPGMGIPMLKIRQWGDRLIFNSLRTHICVNKLTIIGSDNGLSPGRRQAIIWTNAGIVLIRTSGTNKLQWNI